MRIDEFWTFVDVCGDDNAILDCYPVPNKLLPYLVGCPPVSNCFVYALMDPNTHKTRYIGKTEKGLGRVKRHLFSPRARKGNLYVANWLKSLGDQIPYFKIVENCCTGLQVSAMEKSWIKRYKAIGANLTNLTSGGEGISGYKWSEEQRKRPFSKEHKRKLREASKRRDPELVALLTKNLKSGSDHFSEDTRYKMRKAHIGKQHSEETKQKMKDAWKRRKQKYPETNGIKIN